MKLKFSDLMASKCPNIFYDMLGAGKQNGASVDVPDDAANKILARCNEPIKVAPTIQATVTVDPIPFEQWSIAYKALAAFSKPDDIGIGDIIERQIGHIGGDQFKSWYKTIFKKDCGCHVRKCKLNQQYPLSLIPR
jgi:hypothetical protein